MPHLPSDELTAALRSAGDPVRARAEAAYLKSDLAFLGVRLPAIRESHTWAYEVQLRKSRRAIAELRGCDYGT